jgi:sirohydrochlorin cobaltochelatase
MHSGLILFAHGARDPTWAAPFEKVAQQVRRSHPGWHVALAYLECMAPSLAQAVVALMTAGCTRVTVLPMFLGTGGHLRHDLPMLMDQLRQAHRDVDFALLPAVGEIDSVVAAMAGVAGAALQDGG